MILSLTCGYAFNYQDPGNGSRVRMKSARVCSVSRWRFSRKQEKLCKRGIAWIASKRTGYGDIIQDMFNFWKQRRWKSGIYLVAHITFASMTLYYFQGTEFRATSSA